MASEELNQAIKELAQFFSLFTLKDLVGASISDDKAAVRQAIETLRASDAINNQDPIAQFSQLIVDVQTGALFASDIIDRWEKAVETDVGSELGVKFFPLPLTDAYQEKSVKEVVGNPDGLNEVPRSPSKEHPNLAVFSINTARITPSVRNANATALFMNSIPTIELSKCVPFLDIQFQSYRPSLDVAGRPQTLSLTKFLDGGSKLEEGTADHAMHASIPFGQDDMSKDVQGGFSGMEIFTSPQTLVNADSDNTEQNRVAAVIDKFRPFLSIVSLSIDVVATTGIMCYKTANLELVLHDRSRLFEIADFIKPDLAGSHNSELLIEYGWSHPDAKTGINPYGSFLNAMRKKEKYHIKNSSFANKDNGEMTITLELYMKGALDFYTSSVTDGGKIEEAQKAIIKVQEKLADLRARVYKHEDLTKEIRGVQILNVAQDQTSQLLLSKELKKELKLVMSQLTNKDLGPDAKAYLEGLQELYGEKGDGSDGLVRTLNSKVSKQLQDRMKLVEKKNDPFNDSKKTVSFGKLAMIFLGQPLVATGKFDEVQFLFYPMNSGAGTVRKQNVGQFPIDISRFQLLFNKIKKKRLTNNLTLRDFVQFMGTSFFDDPAAGAYGMRNLYVYEKEKGDKRGEHTGEAIAKRKFRKSPTALSHEIDKRLKAIGVPNGTFKMAQLDVYVETVPVESTDNQENNKAINNSQTILRVHFFDRRATSYESLGELLRATRDSDIGLIKSPPPSEEKETDNDHEKIAQQMLQAAQEFGLIEYLENGSDKEVSVIKIKGGPRRLKEFIKNMMPSIDFGSNNTAVISAGFKTMHDPRLSTVNMLRSGDASPLSATGVGQGGIPLWMSPGQMDMNIFGCPLMEFAQGFFVDQQTNTTIDNIYYITKLNHEISLGNFKTTLSFSPDDAYGQYRSLVDRISGAIDFAKKLTTEENP